MLPYLRPVCAPCSSGNSSKIETAGFPVLFHPIKSESLVQEYSGNLHLCGAQGIFIGQQELYLKFKLIKAFILALCNSFSANLVLEL